jgi:hypothetical protein
VVLIEIERAAKVGRPTTRPIHIEIDGDGTAA